LHWVDYERPTSVQDAAALLGKHGDSARCLAGGTDLLVQMRAGRVPATTIIDVKEIPELNQLSYSDAGGLTIGAAVPCYRIYRDLTAMKRYPGVNDVVSLIGGTQIQGRATLGGNLCNAAPSGDAIPMMIAHGVTAKIADADGVSERPVEEICIAPGKTVLEPGELLVSLHFPTPPSHFGARYLRFIPRNEMDIAVAGAGVAVTLDGDTFATARIALASVAPTPLFVKEAGDALAGLPVNDESIQKASELAKAAAKPIDDMRGTARYRSHLCEVLTRRALNDAVRRARGEEVE